MRLLGLILACVLVSACSTYDVRIVKNLGEGCSSIMGADADKATEAAGGVSLLGQEGQANMVNAIATSLATNDSCTDAQQ